MIHPRGFSLIELLVVIGIIAILAGLLLTVVSKAKDKTKQIACLHNVRQLGIGLSQFVSDYHVYPLAGNVGFSSGLNPEHHTTWISALGREAFSEGRSEVTNRWYHKGVWRCPSAALGSFSYGYNSYGSSSHNDLDPWGLGGLHRKSVGNFPEGPIHESEVINPSEMIAIGDGFRGNPGNIEDNVAAIWRTQDAHDTNGSTLRALKRHRGKASVVFCDGHTESPTLESLFTDASEAALKRWNRDGKLHGSSSP